MLGTPLAPPKTQRSPPENYKPPYITPRMGEPMGLAERVSLGNLPLTPLTDLTSLLS